MAKPAIPSIAQAKMLARLWASFGKINVSVEGYNDSTVLACLKRGWLVPTGKLGLYPNRTEYEVHVLSETALDALEGFLRDARMKRANAAPPV